MYTGIGLGCTWSGYLMLGWIVVGWAGAGCCWDCVRLDTACRRTCWSGGRSV